MGRREKNPAAMTAGEVNRELEKLSRESSANCRKFIEAGRGHETWETISRQTDPLALEEQRIHAQGAPPEVLECSRSFSSS